MPCVNGVDSVGVRDVVVVCCGDYGDVVVVCAVVIVVGIAVV